MSSRNLIDTPLVKAIKDSDYESVEKLISDMKNIDENNILEINYLQSEYNYTLLMLACEIGDFEIIELLLEKGADVNNYSYTFSPNAGDTKMPIDSPLSIFCEYNDIPDDIIELFEKYKVNASIPNNKPLWIITRENKLNKERVKLFLENGGVDKYEPYLQEILGAFNPNKYQGSGSILLDIWGKVDPNKSRSYIDLNDPDWINPDIEYNKTSIELINILLDKKVDFTAKNKEGKSLLSYAYGYSDNEEITKLFLENGADENSIYDNGITFIQHAELVKGKQWFLDLFRGNPEALVKLLEKFSEEDLAFTNHAQEAMTYEDFMKKVKDGWDSIESSLKILAPELHTNIEKFFFSENLGSKDNNTNTISWGDNNVTIGFSSPEVKASCDDGYSMLDYVVDDSGSTLEDIMTKDFKDLIVIKDLEAIIDKIAKENKNKNDIKYDIKYDAKIGKFFTDVLVFKKLIKQILSEIKEAHKKNQEKNTSEDNNKIDIKITATTQDEDEFIEIRIIHNGSKSTKTAEDQKKISAGFKEIKKISSPICYWSIDTICSDGCRYLIDYTFPIIKNNESHCRKIDDSIDGFTYVLRFVK